MRRRTFTREQINTLLRNDNVAACSDRYIAFSKKFKMSALALHARGITSNEIFRQAGFDPNIIGQRKPKEHIKRWRNTFKKKGADGLSEISGRPRKISAQLTETNKIKRLKAEVAYLKAENDFLAQLRANKRAG